MATKLNKPLTRESTETANERPIIISLNDNQTISLKLKQMKSGAVSIGIGELWQYLNEGATVKTTTNKPAPRKIDEGEVMVSVTRLRGLNAVTHGPAGTLEKLDEILADLLKGKELH